MDNDSTLEFSSMEDVERLLSDEMKGRNKQMVEYIKKLKTCIKWFMKREDEYQKEQERLRNLCESEEKRHGEIESQLNIKIKDLNSKIEYLLGQCVSLQERFSKEEAEKVSSQQETAKKKKEIVLLTAELGRYREFSANASTEVDSLIADSKILEVQCLSLKQQIKAWESQLGMTKYEEQKNMIKELQDRVTGAENQIFEGEKLRRKLHNTILELRGNIRVFCRVRPALSESDCNGIDGNIVSYPSTFELLGKGIELMHHGQKHSFNLDKVFDHKASQEDVFAEISQLVQSALDGYKVCIFAYGQTGSGKTYTMMGQSEQKGLIPRSLEQIFQISQTLESKGWKYKVQASMLEIYNEAIRDLLSPNRPSLFSPNTVNKLTIRHDSNGNVFVSDLTIVDVCNVEEVSSLLRRAIQSRSVGRTQMNEQSSRSHVVFTLRISGVSERTGEQVQGILNLIDLAGSERLGKSDAIGDRLKETQAINESLSALADVIISIASKDDHVPYRNSKLTYLLQPCLGGDSKTLMFVNISPEASSAGETLCSLRFASRVNACEIGVPCRQAQMRSSDSARHKCAPQIPH